MAILSLVLSLAAIGNAQTVKNTEFEIPFDFVVGNKMFPAGKYDLRSANDQKTGWLIAGKSVRKNRAFFLAKTIEEADRTDEAKLMFRRYGNRYFLAQFIAQDFQITLPKTKGEQLLERELKLAKAYVVKAKAMLQTK